MDVSDLAEFTDYFIICTGTSDRMLQSLADVVSKDIRSSYKIHIKKQGVAEGGWMLMDYGDVVVHLFSPDRRAYYSLEDLWREAKILLKLE